MRGRKASVKLWVSIILVFLLLAGSYFVFFKGDEPQRETNSNNDIFINSNYGNYRYYKSLEFSEGEAYGIPMVAGTVHYSTPVQEEKFHPEILVYVRKMESSASAYKFYNIEQESAIQSNKFSKESFEIGGNSLDIHVFHGLAGDFNEVEGFFVGWTSEVYTVSITYTYPDTVSSIDETLQDPDLRKLLEDYLGKYPPSN